MTLEAYRAVGGVPELPIGEDAAFVSAARRAGFRLAHPMTVWTRVSPRATARAAGGMAATMEALADPRSAALAVPSLDEWRARARWRRSVRLEGGDARVATLEADLPPMQCDTYVVPPLAEGAA